MARSPSPLRLLAAILGLTVLPAVAQAQTRFDPDPFVGRYVARAQAVIIESERGRGFGTATARLTRRAEGELAVSIEGTYTPLGRGPSGAVAFSTSYLIREDRVIIDRARLFAGAKRTSAVGRLRRLPNGKIELKAGTQSFFQGEKVILRGDLVRISLEPQAKRFGRVKSLRVVHRFRPLNGDGSLTANMRFQRD